MKKPEVPAMKRRANSLHEIGEVSMTYTIDNVGLDHQYLSDAFKDTVRALDLTRLATPASRYQGRIEALFQSLSTPQNLAALGLKRTYHKV
jgi:hypothetical protein